MPAAEPEDSLSAFVVRMRKRPISYRKDEATAASTQNHMQLADGDAVLRLFQDGASLSSSDISAALGVSNTTAYRRLKKLVDAGAVERVGKGRSARYRLV